MSELYPYCYIIRILFKERGKKAKFNDFHGSGLTTSQIDALSQICTIRPPGRSELENGQLGHTLSKIKECKAWVWAPEMFRCPVYIIGHPDLWYQINDRIGDMALMLKRYKYYTGIQANLLRMEEYGAHFHPTPGWVDIENGFFFFTSRHLWTKFKRLMK